MIYKIRVLIGALIIIFIASAVMAEQQQSRLELDFGTSHNLQKFNQILNPDAEKNLAPVEGFDGRAAQRTVEQNLKKFETPQKDPTYSFSIGGTGTK